MDDLIRIGASEAARRIANGKLTSVRYTEALLARIAEREPVVGAWIHLDPDAALAQARAADRRAPAGPLHGVPVGLKDIIDTADMPTGYGSPIYAGHRPGRDARSVAQLRAAGAVILGKTVTAEFATYHPGKTANPHNPAHTPGGSSSGSAAAVADFHTPLSLGTQTAGSIIRPASFNGILGYKPTFDDFDYGGLHALAPSLDTLGVFARDFEDLSLSRQVLSRRPVRAVAAPAAFVPRIGVCRTPMWPKGDADMQQAYERTVERLASAGAELAKIELPADFKALIDAQTLIFMAEGARHLEREWREPGALLSPELRDLLERGRACSESAVAAAHALALRCRAQLADLMRPVDVLLVPSSVGEAPAGLYATGDPVFSRIWTHLHVPCITYPIGLGDQQLPLGAQVVGAHRDDDRLIEIAWWMAERSAKWTFVA
ncbi:MAG TPA: amidase [Aromatoleum sp.]|uniref:amidase n=1 Tax=Aromatoleum sp. TaxID=2307007 RepID=UPI002B4871F3|nr:amidase [Aromatoleum sp.]HJV25952.1 amidase [Aromatoleum sp.]